MTEYDAFGRPVDEASAPANPLGETQASPVEPGTASAPIPATPAPIHATPAVRRSRRAPGAGCIVALVALVITIGVPVAIGVFAFSQVSDTIDSVTHSISKSFTTATTSTSTSGSGSSATPPDDLSRDSLLRRANFRQAMSEIRRLADRGQVTLLRVDARRVDVQVRTAGGTLRFLQRPWDGKASVLSSSQGGAGGPVLRWSQVNAAAPERLARALRGRMNYAVLLAATRGWSAYRTDGVFYTAGLTGRGAQRVGG